MKENAFRALSGIQITGILLFVIVVIVGGLPIEHSTKIALTVIGGLFLGFLMAIHLSFLQSNATESEKINSNSAEARELIRDSLNRSIYQPLLGRDLQKYEMPGKANLDLVSSIKSFVAICMCFSLSMMLWYEPSLIEFSFSSSVSHSELIKQVALQVFYVLIISTGFAGIFLNLFGKYFRRSV
jgi:hypothetical protein